MAEPNALSRQFDDVAQLYDEVRPRYPEELIEYIITFAALPTYGRIFEVGCGTGQMTLPFAKRRYAVLALDQGERLAALAAQHCQPYPQVRVVPCAFEAWQDAAGSYDLFLSAQAFHWIEPQYGLARAADLLKTGGTIALVWTLDRSQGSAFWQVTQRIYDTYNPVTSSARPLTGHETYRHALRTSRQFVGVHEVRHPWTKRYAGAEYLKLLMIIRPDMNRWRHLNTPHIAGASARNSSIPTARRLIQPGAGWWNGRWHGSPNVETSSFGMRKRPSIS